MKTIYSVVLAKTRVLIPPPIPLENIDVGARISIRGTQLMATSQDLLFIF
jgi:hypothetical protein